MVICRKVESRELPETSGTNGRNGNGRNGRRARSSSDFQGGPIFLPSRPPSPFVRALLASVEGHGDADELGFAARLRVS
jgi:hypothetical protein